MLDQWVNDKAEKDAAEQQDAEDAVRIIQNAVSQVKDPAEASEVVAELLQQYENRTVGDVSRCVNGDVRLDDVVSDLSRVAIRTEGAMRAKAVLAQLSVGIAQTKHKEQDKLMKVAERAMHPELTGETPENERKRQWMREAVLETMTPIEAGDARLYLAMDGLPRPAPVKRLLSAVSALTSGGHGWTLAIVLAMLLDRKHRRKHRAALLAFAPPFYAAQLTLKYVLKPQVSKRRSLRDIVRMIIIGKKPNPESIPSGHTNAGFGGALLAAQQYPSLTPAIFGWATLAGFSRLYLGAHYPTEIISGALSGTALAWVYGRAWRRLLRGAQQLF